MDISLNDKIAIQPGVVTYQWTTPEPVVWQAGQYGVFYIDHPNWDSKGPERKFTISAAPHEPLAFTTRSSTSSFKKTLAQLNIGQTIQLKNIGGQFTIKPGGQQHLTLIAGGIGITPFRAMLIDSIQHHQQIVIQLLYINADEHFIFQRELDNLSAKSSNFSVEYLVGRQSLSLGTLSQIPDLANSQIYVSGPTPFLDNVEAQLQEVGVGEDTIQFDDFEEDWPA